MGDSVKHQLENAKDALRSALELGAIHEDVWTLSQIASGLSTVERLLATTEQKDFTLKNPYYNGYVGGSSLSDDVITFK